MVEVQQLLDLRAGQTLVELGCGRAGYGLAAIAQPEALLIGVDFSAGALRAAEAAAGRIDLVGRATFRQADSTRTGLADGSAGVVLCVGAFHFADPGDAARECRRLLKPGGRMVMTTSMPISPEAAPRLPERIARMDIERDLGCAGLVDIEASPRPDWLRREAALWAEAATLLVGDDEALASLRHEALEFLTLVDGPSTTSCPRPGAGPIESQSRLNSASSPVAACWAASAQSRVRSSHTAGLAPARSRAPAAVRNSACKGSKTWRTRG